MQASPGGGEVLFQHCGDASEERIGKSGEALDCLNESGKILTK